MSIKLQNDTTVVFNADDILAMITDQVCDYSPFAKLRAAYINQQPDGTFSVTFEPKPTPKGKEPEA